MAAVLAPAGPDQWRPGDAWLAGGTALFGAPHPDVVRLLDLHAARWPALTVRPDGLEVAATCTLAELAAFDPPPGMPALRDLAGPCCDALLASFKVAHQATVGGNLCAALPAGPMAALAAALDGTCRVLGPGGVRRTVDAAGFVTGDGTTVLRPGELLRAVHLPAAGLTGRAAVRRASLFTHGRSAVLLAARRAPDGAFTLVVTAATWRPRRLRFPAVPGAGELALALAAIPAAGYVDDVHGDPAWRRHLTGRLAEGLRRDLAAG